MKAIYSITNNNKSSSNHYGFPERTLFLKSLILSITRAKEFFNDITIYCDKQSETILNEINLDVNIKLQFKKDTQSKQLYSSPKLESILLQKEPFVHLDFDMWLLDNFNPNGCNKNIITLNRESSGQNKWYKRMLQDFLNNKTTPIEIIQEYAKCGLPVSVYNTGLLGGNDLKTLKEFSKLLIDYMKLESKIDNNWSSGKFTEGFLEQYWLSVFCDDKNIEISTIYNHDTNLAEWQGPGFYRHLFGTCKTEGRLLKILEKDFEYYCGKLSSKWSASSL